VPWNGVVYRLAAVEANIVVDDCSPFAFPPHRHSAYAVDVSVSAQNFVINIAHSNRL
jgi:hypothetical protein